MIITQIETSRKLFEIAKKQFNSGEITKIEYFEILELILEKINKENLKYEQLENLKSIFELPDFKVNLKELINFSLSIN